MIDGTQAFWLALLQGLTEFLPISSSGHLVLIPHIFGWPDQGLTFDVAVHLGTLCAVFIYFRRDVSAISFGVVNCLRRRGTDESGRLGVLIVLATLPGVVAGIFLDPIIGHLFRDPLVIAATTAGYGFLLLVSDVFGSKRRTMNQLTWLDALIIGIAQALALIPGTSRAGVTMTAALMLGVQRSAAARFSFLLSIPIILAASVFKGRHLAVETIDWLILGIGIIVSGSSAWLVITIFLKWIERVGMWPFVLYRIALGICLLLLFR